MAKEHIHLTEAEWSVMECLWEHSPRTGREVTQDLAEKEGWNRSTTLTLLSRLESKGAVSSNNEGTKKTSALCFSVKMLLCVRPRIFSVAYIRAA